MEMNKNTYVRDILKSIGARSGMKLYTSPYGVCTFQNIGLDRINLCYEHDRVGTFFSVSLKGRMSEGGELVLFPSKNMRDWSKFGWNKGDVLRCDKSTFCIFEKWHNDDYTEFNGKFVTDGLDDEVLNTANWFKEGDENAVLAYISNIEEAKGGQLNLNTLSVERVEGFKDGDIVTLEENPDYPRLIAILKHESVSMLGTYAFMNVFGNFVCFGIDAAKGGREVRLATEEEKQKLYDALAKEGKRWNPDDKKIENLPQKYKFKMFDKVLGRKHDGFWSPAIYIHYDTNRNEHYVFDIAFGVNVWVEECISFEKNEEIAFVIGNEKEDNNHE